MHAEAMSWVAAHVPEGKRRVLDIGGRDINGNPQALFDHGTTFEVVDPVDGPAVTWVGVVADYTTKSKFDTVLCLEVAEHAEEWEGIVGKAADLMKPGGVFIFTAAGPTRAPHSAMDGGGLKDGEFYENIDPKVLAKVLAKHFVKVQVDELGADVRAVAVAK